MQNRLRSPMGKLKILGIFLLKNWVVIVVIIADGDIIFYTCKKHKSFAILRMQ